MTTIAIDLKEKCMVMDSLATYTQRDEVCLFGRHLWYYGPSRTHLLERWCKTIYKKHLHKEGRYIVGSGTVGHIHRYLDALPKRKVKYLKESCVMIIDTLPDLRIELHEKSGLSILTPENCNIVVIGSGSQFFRGAFEAGKDIGDAMEVAKKLDPGTGSVSYFVPLTGVAFDEDTQ